MTKRLFRLKRTWLAVIGAASLTTGLLAFVAPSTSSADNPSGCDFSPNNNGVAGCLGPLSGSTFAGGDGNLLTNPTAFGTTDWQNVTGLNAGFDLPSGTGDNSFGQGTKEDNPNVTVVSGSIPPNKSDLSRFYEASETGTNNHNFLYLGWERTNVLGSANMDFEINHNSTAGFTGSTTGPVTLNRTAGDLLVTYDFTNGGGTPTIGLQRWLTGATTPAVPGFATNACFSIKTFPCWGDQLTLNGTDSVAAVNNLDAVTDPLFPGSPNYINPVPALQFGETAIDLTAAGVFPPGTCQGFGSAFVKSRSSASFTAEAKDFIAPIPVNISNCGSIKIIKHSDPRGVNQVFSYASNLPAEPAGTVGGVAQGGVTCPGSAGAGVQSDGSFCLNDAGNSAGVDSAGNTVFNPAVPIGTYTVTEGAEPSGFTPESLSCLGGTTSTSGETATINLKPGDQVVCTYVNQQNIATLGTLVSNAGPVFPSQSVQDTATVVGNQAADTPSGLVTFFLCNSVPCSSGGTNIGTGSLSGSAGTASANSPAVNTTTSPLTPGTYCFRAEWPGDTNYPAPLAEFGGANGTNECFTIQTIKTTTKTTPSVGSGGNTTFNSVVTDTALITAAANGGGTPTGNVAFFVCTPTQVTANGGTCSSGGSPVGSSVPTTAVANSNPPQSTATSSGVTANATGTWCFRGVYTPGPPNGANYTGSSDASTGECFTVTDTTTSTSLQDWLPNDTATVGSAHGAPLNGTLSAQLFTGDNCGTTSGSAVNGQLYSKALTGTGSSATLTTNNTSFKVTVSSSVSWLVNFVSSDSNVGNSTHCEVTSLAINN
jgi:hypothetical protein